MRGSLALPAIDSEDVVFRCPFPLVFELVTNSASNADMIKSPRSDMAVGASPMSFALVEAMARPPDGSREIAISSTVAVLLPGDSV